MIINKLHKLSDQKVQRFTLLLKNRKIFVSVNDKVHPHFEAIIQNNPILEKKIDLLLVSLHDYMSFYEKTF